MGKMFVGAIWGVVLVLSIWSLTVYTLESNSALPVLAVFGLIGCGIAVVCFVLKLIIDNWD